MVSNTSLRQCTMNDSLLVITVPVVFQVFTVTECVPAGSATWQVMLLQVPSQRAVTAVVPSGAGCEQFFVCSSDETPLAWRRNTSHHSDCFCSGENIELAYFLAEDFPGAGVAFDRRERSPLPHPRTARQRRHGCD